MPEIKHNFTGGKMNKDLDERLVPNGQYRDAMNIQVSTSQAGESVSGSEVGTVQNILGNSLVPGQDFIYPGAKCVGSIADEKNDTLYWFISNSLKELLNANFNASTQGALTHWKELVLPGFNNNILTTYDGTASVPFTNYAVTGGGWYWDSTNNTLVAKNVDTEQRAIYAEFAPMEIKRGRTYVVRIKIVSLTGGGRLSPVLVDELGGWTKPDERFAADNNQQWWTWTLRVGEENIDQQSNLHANYPPGTLYIENVTDTSNGNGRLFCTIEKIKIEEVTSSCIAEYNTKKNIVKPVFIDSDNTVLKFNPYNLITGVNIIDDFLFWTDNTNEPKKINIPRSIEGTIGYAHTNIINPSQNYGTKQGERKLKAQEEDITVIKKSPLHPLSLHPELIREEFDINDQQNIYTGIIKTSDTKEDDHSFIGSTLGEIHDFSFLQPGDKFKINIETDITGSNNFTLKNWRPWKNVVLKEFDNNNPPSIPINQDYTIRGKITDWWGNKFTNENLPIIDNGDLSEVDANNDPIAWNLWGEWNYDATNKLLDAGGSLEGGDHDKAFSFLNETIEADKEYRIKYTVSENINNDPLTGSVRVMLFDNDGTAGSNGGGHWAHLGRHDSTGTYEHHHVFKLIDDSGGGNGNKGPWPHSASYLNSLVFEQLPVVGGGVEYFENIPVDFNSVTSFTPDTDNVWSVVSANTMDVDSSLHTMTTNNNDIYFNNIHTTPLVDDELYDLTLTITGFTGTGWVGLSGPWANQVPTPSHAQTHSFRIGSPHGNSAPQATFDPDVNDIMEVDANGDATLTLRMRANSPSNSSKLDVRVRSSSWGSNFFSQSHPTFTIEVDVKRVRKEVFNGAISNIIVEEVDAVEQARVEIEIENIKDPLPVIPSNSSELKYAIDLEDNEDIRLFEDKFPRFAYRYKYIDGEHSTISPFTKPAFYPGSFSYHPTKGFNAGMKNSLKRLVIGGYNKMLPSGVESIDLLYKEEHSPNIYIVETIKNLNQWQYVIEGETIRNGLVDSSQLLRLWDNVPKKALAQDIIGNRIVYGNYTQNYNLIDNTTLKDFELNINVNRVGPKSNSITGKPSIKSLREYQVGIVYTDKYGRETPIITNSDAIIKIPKYKSDTANYLEIEIKNEGYPVNMKYWKFYIKDTGGDYHNLAMDRYYDAEDDNIWLAFPSSDRNKIDIDDYIILKKSIGAKDDISELVESKLKRAPKHKILDIKNEAPSFIKRKETRIASINHNNSNPLFRSNNLPVEGDINFDISHNNISSRSYAKLHEDFGADTSVEYFISFHADYNNLVTDRYKVIQLHGDDSSGTPLWRFTLDRPLTSEINDFSNDETGNAVTQIKNGTKLNLYRLAPDDAQMHKFEGRFFVKIYNDDIFAEALKEKVDEDNIEYKLVGQNRKFYSLKTVDDSNRLDKHYDKLEGQINNTVKNQAFFAIDQANGSAGLNTDVTSKPLDPAFSWKNYNRITNEFGFFLGSMSKRQMGQSIGSTEATPHFSVMNPTNLYLEDRHNENNVWRDYDAYFRGINVSLHNSAVRRYRTSDIKLNSYGDGDIQKFQDVWFIDGGKCPGHMNYSSMGADQGWYSRPSTAGLGGHHQSLGHVAAGKGSKLEIAFGGVQPNKWADGQEAWTGDESFFDLENGNNNYSGSEADFIKQIAIGGQFRFKEDPDGEIYTITGITHLYRIRYETLTHFDDARWGTYGSVEDKQWPLLGRGHGGHLWAPDLFPLHARAREGKPTGVKRPDAANGPIPGGLIANVAFDPNITGQHDIENEGLKTKVTIAETDGGIPIATNTFLRPSNYTRNWRLTLNKSFTNRWNPVEDTNVEITKGKVVRLSCPTTSTINANTIVLDSIDNELTSENIHPIRLVEGMVLKKFTGTDGSTITDLNKYLIVSEIEVVDDGVGNITYELKFRTYNGDDDLATGNFLNDQITKHANTKLHFYQFPMNNLSPNSAKNLNYFRGGRTFDDAAVGTDAIGYTIEFIEPKSSRSEEELLPDNPAVWETVPKEDKNLDIYYEASDTLPIQLELNRSNILNYIPIGSTIEHLNSSTIPPSTKVHDINEETGEIILTHNIQVAKEFPFITVNNLTRN